MSILRFLLLMLLSIITLVSFTAALMGYRSSVQQAEHLFDSNLQEFSRALQSITSQPSMLTVVPQEEIAFQIWQQDSLVIRSNNTPEQAIGGVRSGFGEANFNGQRWRTFVHYDKARQRFTIVAQPLAERIELAESVALASLSPLVVAMPLLAVLIMVTIRRGLSPLKKLSEMLRHKQAHDFAPLYLKESPGELRPVVATINRLLAKVAAAFEREKRFSADAAHELRTPISVLQVSIHNLSEQHPELQQELDQLQTGVLRMSHVVEQILLLNRTHPDNFKTSFSLLSLQELCQQCIASCFDEIDNKGQTIELKSQPAMVQGENFALLTLLNNLILNASKYTPRGGRILVTVEPVDKGIKLVIEDSGPGIPEQDYARVLDRFYRSASVQNSPVVTGCGLGMAIVKQVVELHGASIQLGKSSLLGGLQVTIVFPGAES